MRRHKVRAGTGESRGQLGPREVLSAVCLHRHNVPEAWSQPPCLWTPIFQPRDQLELYTLCRRRVPPFPTSHHSLLHSFSEMDAIGRPVSHRNPAHLHRLVKAIRISYWTNRRCRMLHRLVGNLNRIWLSWSTLGKKGIQVSRDFASRRSPFGRPTYGELNQSLTNLIDERRRRH